MLNILETSKKIKLAIPQLRYMPDPVLRQMAVEVSGQEAIAIGNELGETLIKFRQIAGFGRGLASPQIGVCKAVYVTFIDERLEIYANPKIIEISSETNYYRELCLSCDSHWGDIPRPARIKMTWMTTSGETMQRDFEKFEARLHQHEQGHLKGELCYDLALSGSWSLVNSDPLKEVLREKPLYSRH